MSRKATIQGFLVVILSIAVTWTLNVPWWLRVIVWIAVGFLALWWVADHFLGDTEKKSAARRDTELSKALVERRAWAVGNLTNLVWTDRKAFKRREDKWIDPVVQLLQSHGRSALEIRSHLINPATE